LNSDLGANALHGRKVEGFSPSDSSNLLAQGSFHENVEIISVLGSLYLSRASAYPRVHDDLEGSRLGEVELPAKLAERTRQPPDCDQGAIFSPDFDPMQGYVGAED